MKQMIMVPCGQDSQNCKLTFLGCMVIHFKEIELEDNQRQE